MCVCFVKWGENEGKGEKKVTMEERNEKKKDQGAFQWMMYLSLRVYWSENGIRVKRVESVLVHVLIT